ncbi:MAG TPA: DUF4136 domain-containing protein [Polyangiaceae bacterium]
MRTLASKRQPELLLLLAPLTIAACYPEPLTTGEMDVVITVKDSGRNYAELKTYALPDQVFDLCEIAAELGEGGAAGGFGSDDDDDECEDVSHRYDDEVLDAIADNLEALGFVAAQSPEAADVVVFPGITAQDNWYVYTPYCDYWYSYWYPYCWYYPWTATAVNYPVGSLVLYMLAPVEADDVALKMPVVWMGVVRGILSSYADTNAERVEAGIDQAFAQSGYLGGGK